MGDRGANGTCADGIYLVFQCIDAFRIEGLGPTLTLTTHREITDKHDIKYRPEEGYSLGRQGTIPILTLDQVTRAAPSTYPAYNCFYMDSKFS